MHLTPREQERLTIFTVAELARRRRARGRVLNAPEAVALLCDEILERAWDGVPLDDIVEQARSLLTADDVMDGVADLVPQVQVEAMFPSGTALVAVDRPFGPPRGAGPGAVAVAAGDVEINAGRDRGRLAIRNGGELIVYLSSHFPLAEANPALSFDRAAAAGMRLDVPAGTAVAFPPGTERLVEVVRA
ncbi:urease subunit gamma/beta [Sphaerisporangium rufum]|uniref:urease n=1 Tax=Sphaerisporangium rufum TaxID=1381558 RepID=A0A919QZM2_9ACTN|nr:urease subunit gamma [Sphaerisporangium rufum]GII77094.1 urease subunit gamma/beta [Sphaerisporangium rufum]